MSDEPTSTGTPWRRDPSALARGLTAWAADHLGDAIEVIDFSAPDNGMSSETILFSLSDRSQPQLVPTRYVARLAPDRTAYPVFMEYDLSLQKRCMELVAGRTDVPVPATPFLVDDGRWLGSPFLVMTRIDGVVPTDNPPYVFGGWVAEARAEQRTRMQTSAVDVLTGIHAITPSNADLRFLERPQYGSTPLDQQLGYQRAYYEWAREGQRYPLIERTFAWLDANRGEESAPVFTWGDARIGNMLWDDFVPVGVLDWEMATVGPPEVDLAWMVFIHRFFQSIAERYGLPGIDRFMDRAEVAAAYERSTGRVVRQLEWFEVFAALRFAIVSIRTTMRGVAYGEQEPVADPDDVIMFRPLLEQMLDGGYWS